MEPKWNQFLGHLLGPGIPVRQVYKALHCRLVLDGGGPIGAMREMILANEDPAEIERFKRFWVQAVNSSGLQQAEYEETGEKDFFQADGDGDGIPRMEYGDGKHGIAPVFASLIRIQTPKTR